MSTSLKVILKQTQPFYQQGAPLLLEAHAMYQEEATGQLIAQLKWRNLSHKTVQAVNVILHCADSFGATLEETSYQYMDVSAPSQAVFGTQNAIRVINERTRECTVSITDVSFTDGTIWRAIRGKTCEPLPNSIPQKFSGALFSQFERDLKSQGIEEARHYTPQTQDDLWQCGCGNWQKKADETCIKCSATMAQILKLSEPNALEMRLEAYNKAEEEKRIAMEKERLEQEKRDKALKKEQAAKAKKNKCIGVIVTTIVVALVAVYVFVLTPMIDYNEANTLLEEGKFDEATYAFNEMGDYSDSKIKAMEAQYRKGKFLLQNARYDEATNLFLQLNDYMDSKTRALEAQYKKGEMLLENKKYDEATIAFLKAGVYLDASTRAYKLHYDYAEELLKQGKYDDAAENFLKAGTYSDASTRAYKLHYDHAEELLKEGEYDDAVASFTKAKKYSDAEERIFDTYYQKAQALLAQGEYDEATENFLNAGAYSDASTRAYKLHYDHAENLLAQGKYDDAVESFQKARKYSDAEERVLDTYYQNAKALMASKDYVNAYDLFLTMKGYKDVDNLLATADNLLAAAKKPFTQVNNIVTYGQYEQENNTNNGKEDIEWIVLDYDQLNDRALLISKYGLEALAYQEGNVFTDYPTWAKSDIRAWLNKDFLNSAFTAKEQAGIQTVTVSTPSFWGHSGGADTQDKVWLLSREEAETYFKSDDARKTKATAYANANGASEYKGCCWWWLRSPSYLSDGASYVDYDGSLYGSNVSYSDYVARPAFWLDLKSADIY